MTATVFLLLLLLLLCTCRSTLECCENQPSIDDKYSSTAEAQAELMAATSPAQLKNHAGQCTIEIAYFDKAAATHIGNEGLCVGIAVARW